jgi:hypothetical protein
MMTFVLEGEEPEPFGNTREWAKWMRENDRAVGFTRVGTIMICTEFLGMDDVLPGETPALWETVIMKPGGEMLWQRYRTMREARAGHRRAVALVREELAVSELDEIELRGWRDEQGF